MQKREREEGGWGVEKKLGVTGGWSEKRRQKIGGKLRWREVSSFLLFFFFKGVFFGARSKRKGRKFEMGLKFCGSSSLSRRKLRRGGILSARRAQVGICSNLIYLHSMQVGGEGG